MNRKNIVWTVAAFVVITAVFNMLCFWLVAEYTDSFYVSIAFGNGSLLVLLLSSILMSRKGKYMYLSLQNALFVCGYTTISVILNLIFALAKMNNTRANIITNVILLAIDLVILFSIYASTAAITAQIEQDRKERNAYYDLKDKAELLLNKGNSIAVNKKIESMYDKICSCQINRTVDVSYIDLAISSELDNISELLKIDSNDINEHILKVISLIDERNRLIQNSLKR
ncbi:MAG: hypothetical protein LUD27_05595 [Clostridia bacterium]|nr:hypothetical protein [Clostridia bacterium]